MLPQLLISGLALGAAYALVALGFVLVLNASRAVNFAHGDLVAAGGFATVALATLLPVPAILLLPAVLIVMAAVGLAIAALAYFPLSRRPPAALFVSTIAVGLIIRNGLDALFGAAPRAGPPLLGAGLVEIGPAVASRQSIAIIVAAALLIALLWVLLARTRMGKRLRASAEDPEMARALGVPVARMVAFAFALAAALAGAAGLLLANQFFVTPEDGGALMLKAYVAAALGGWGRLAGAVAGALAIAFFEVGVASLLSYPVAEALLYASALAILALRPQGLFPEHAGQRA
ncbi:MAG TPA: branched-chain amino acid ABC transporter permease [Methylomirabilota bacterium]|jgi:branched-chain amino acid transport system permease protein|nr:branched-chain amino acid ABC transporter permease [Methylomirabilota bacterium]